MEYQPVKKRNLAVALAGILAGMILATAVFAFAYIYYLIGLREIGRAHV